RRGRPGPLRRLPAPTRAVPAGLRRVRPAEPVGGLPGLPPGGLAGGRARGLLGRRRNPGGRGRRGRRPAVPARGWRRLGHRRGSGADRPRPAGEAGAGWQATSPRALLTRPRGRGIRGPLLRPYQRKEASDIKPREPVGSPPPAVGSEVLLPQPVRG